MGSKEIVFFREAPFGIFSPGGNRGGFLGLGLDKGRVSVYSTPLVKIFMTEVRPLSADLAELITKAEGSESTPVMKRWIAMMGARAVLESPIPDEQAVIEKVREMLGEACTDYFYTKPESVLVLEARYLEVTKDIDAHLRAVLFEQRSRCRAVLGTVGRNEKRLRNLYRGLERRDREYAELLDAIDNFMDKEVDHIILRYALRIVKNSPCVRRGPSLHHDIQTVFNRYMDRLTHLVAQMHIIEDEIEILERDLRNAGRFKPLMERLDAQFRALPTVRDSGGDVLRSRALPVGIPSGIRRKGKGASVDTEGVPVVAKSEESVASIFALDLSRIRQAMAIADEKHVPLRVVVSPEGNVRRRNSAQWEDLLRKLGFQGQVRFVIYEELASNGRESPIIMPRRLNTHKNKQGGYTAPTFVIETPQNLLMNSLGN
ncbi:MAG: hypothetical protein UW03_C0006G0040 [Candidatus Peregrinibacteria bacterium GW2011_GWA2_43_8]|nr:MAG: hypothetical protein UW03_C0006G0040 [Candidatus Peregrinibacteria bacterium GW2011_GWA2_43_8]